jgi:hypothetical protein
VRSPFPERSKAARREAEPQPVRFVMGGQPAFTSRIPRLLL